MIYDLPFEADIVGSLASLGVVDSLASLGIEENLASLEIGGKLGIIGYCELIESTICDSWSDETTSDSSSLSHLSFSSSFAIFLVCEILQNTAMNLTV